MEFKILRKLRADQTTNPINSFGLHKFGLVQAFETLFKFIFNCKFQVRPDSIQSNVDDLMKGLNEHCKKYGLLAQFPWFAYSRCPIRKSPVIHYYF